MVELRIMSDAEVEIYVRDVIRRYAAARVESGEWVEEDAQRQAEAVVARLLPDGAGTANSYLWSLDDTGRNLSVGRLWVQLRRRGVTQAAHILDLYINPKERRKGRARQALEGLERLMREQGVGMLTLNVFGNNKAAIALYRELHFEVAELAMEKRL